MKKKPIFFEDALQAAIKFAKDKSTNIGDKFLLIRNILGQISIVVEDNCSDDIKNEHQLLAKEFSELLQQYAPDVDAVFLYKDELFAPDIIFKSEDIHIFEDSGIRVLDRQLINQDWTRPSFSPQEEQKTSYPPRATLFGIKGGSGRSTALAIWAWHLANLGKKVLVLDLDLESPGVSKMLLSGDSMPNFGIVDWFVENAVGQKTSILQDMVANSPLMKGSNGQIRIVPAGGKGEKDYIAKLSRVYTDLNQSGVKYTFSARLEQLLTSLELQEKPDIVLLDSRAGLHDIAATTITRLNATVFLFGMNTPQTWQGYRYLFNHWQRWSQKNLAEFRENLKIVMGMIPEMGSADYLSEAKTSAYNLFSETLYEEDDGNFESNMDVFNFSMADTTAPHYPLRIYWSRVFLEFDPIKQPDLFEPRQIDANYGEFLEEASRLVLGDERNG